MHAFLNPSQTPNRESVELALKDYGFYHDLGDVMRMYSEYVNNRQYGYAGGVLDQPDAYWHDMAIMRNLALWVEHFAPLVGFTDEVSIFEKLLKGESIL